MNKIKLILIGLGISSILIFILSLMLKISNLKDEILKLERDFKNKEIAYVTLKSSYDNLSVACERQSVELKKLAKDTEQKIKDIEAYYAALDSEKYNDKVQDIFNTNIGGDSCSNLKEKIKKIGRLKYKDL